MSKFMDALGSTETLTAAELRSLYRIEDEDLARVRAAGVHITPHLDTMVDAFYRGIRQLPEFERLFTSPEKVQRVRDEQIRYWTRFFEGRLDEEYIYGRSRLGSVHATIGLSLRSYHTSMSLMLDLSGDVLAESALAPGDQASHAGSVTKLAQLDTGIVVQAFSQLNNRIISEQSEAIMAMSTPIATIWSGILMLPIVGIIDSQRAQMIMSKLLERIRSSEADVCILDISGVAVVDTAVANHFIKMTKAARLMGCECIISGLSPSVTQTIVELGIDVDRISTRATLKDALAIAFRKTQYVVTRRQD